MRKHWFFTKKRHKECYKLLEDQFGSGGMVIADEFYDSVTNYIHKNVRLMEEPAKPFKL